MEEGRNSSCLRDASATHLLLYCTANLLLLHIKDAGWRADTEQLRAAEKNPAEIQSVMESEGTLNSLTQTIHSYHLKCKIRVG